MFPGGCILLRPKSVSLCKDLQPTLECGLRKPLLWYAPCFSLIWVVIYTPIRFYIWLLNRKGIVGLTYLPYLELKIATLELKIATLELKVYFKSI